TASQRLRHGFIAVQIALAFILLAGASLLRLSLDRALAVSPGFRVDHVLSGRISLPWKNYQTTEAQDAFIQRLLAEMGHLPGMQAAAAINSIPLSGTTQKSAITVKGYIPPPGESLRGHFSYGVAGDYFAAMGIPLREGRLLGVADAADRVRSCVVDEAFARRYWPAGHALGQRLTLGGELAADEELFTVVGVVGGIKQEDLTESEAQGAVYFPFRHRSDSTFYLVTRTSQPPEALGAALQNTVRRLDPELPVNDLQSMEVRLASSLLTRRSPALLTSIFAGTALLLAVLGTYGVLSYAVMQRRREIGVRLALGALPRQIAAQFLTLGGKLLAAGAVMGIVGAWISARTMQGILFGIPRLPLSIIVGAGAILALAALAACLLPIWRALRVAPAEALKND
ncbi:MAG TPA: ABC transporter permease, partial [Candidatus Limnocylindria bacterium]|nr:ABC transporter permease [Candidatus Limnocylindria bacterium]